MSEPVTQFVQPFTTSCGKDTGEFIITVTGDRVEIFEPSFDDDEVLTRTFPVAVTRDEFALFQKVIRRVASERTSTKGLADNLISLHDTASKEYRDGNREYEIRVGVINYVVTKNVQPFTGDVTYDFIPGGDLENDGWTRFESCEQDLIDELASVKI